MNYLKAILTKLIGQRDIELQDLTVYINNPVGVAEEIEIKISNIDALESKIETINKILKQLEPTKTDQ